MGLGQNSVRYSLKELLFNK